MNAHGALAPCRPICGISNSNANQQTNERTSAEKKCHSHSNLFQFKIAPQTIKSENIYSMRIRRYIFIFFLSKHYNHRGTCIANLGKCEIPINNNEHEPMPKYYIAELPSTRVTAIIWMNCVRVCSLCTHWFTWAAIPIGAKPLRSCQLFCFENKINRNANILVPCKSEKFACQFN